MRHYILRVRVVEVQKEGGRDGWIRRRLYGFIGDFVSSNSIYLSIYLEEEEDDNEEDKERKEEEGKACMFG